jgi:hypothetical protein
MKAIVFTVVLTQTKGPSFWSQNLPGTDFMILKIFSPKIFRKIAFLTQNKAKLCKILIPHWFLRKTPIFWPKNWQKSQKIVIKTSAPGCLVQMC